MCAQQANSGHKIDEKERRDLQPGADGLTAVHSLENGYRNGDHPREGENGPTLHDTADDEKDFDYGLHRVVLCCRRGRGIFHRNTAAALYTDNGFGMDFASAMRTVFHVIIS